MEFQNHKDMSLFLKGLGHGNLTIPDHTNKKGFIFTGTEYMGEFTQSADGKKVDLELTRKYEPEEQLKPKFIRR